MKCLLIVFLLSTIATAQHAPAKKPRPKTVPTLSVPQLGDDFAKIGLKVLFATQSDSYKAKELTDDLRAEMDTAARPNEVGMYANLLNYSIFHESMKLNANILRSDLKAKCYSDGMDGGQPGLGCGNPDMVELALIKTDGYKALLIKEGRCVGTLESALRNRSSVPLPDSCK